MVSDCFIMICSYCSKSKAIIIQYSHPSMCPFGSSWFMFLCLMNDGLSPIMSFSSFLQLQEIKALKAKMAHGSLL